MRLADSKPNLAGLNLEKSGFNVAQTNCCASSELQPDRKPPKRSANFTDHEMSSLSVLKIP